MEWVRLGVRSLLVGAIILLAGCSAPEPASPSATPPVSVPAPATTGASGTPPANETRAWEIPAYAWRELNMALETGAPIRYTLTSSADIAWDLHSHAADGSVLTHASGTGRAAEGSFEAPTAGTYSLFAEAGAEAASVRVDVEGAFEVT